MSDSTHFPGPSAGPGQAAAWSTRFRYRLRYAAEAVQSCWKQVQGARCLYPTGRGPLRAAALALAAVLLLSTLALRSPPALTAHTPEFHSDPAFNPFGLADVGWAASPTFADLDGDGDLDGFVGNDEGNTIYFQNTGSASSPAFAASTTNPFGLADVGWSASPTFADLDGDGDLDGFVGNNAGYTLYFQNTGTSSSPAFAASTQNLFGLADVGFAASPAFADLDGDGDLDAFVGNYAGSILYFQNTGTSSSPAFASSSANPFGLADVGACANPTFADLDNDGDLDAFVGNSAGNTVYLQNTGSSSTPAFASSTANPFGLAGVWYHVSPAFADLDDDGDPDGFLGNYDGNIAYFRNTGAATNPAFVSSGLNPFGLANVGLHASPTFADLDRDGDLDAFVGNSDGNTLYFQNTGSSSTPAFAASTQNPFGLADVGYRASPTFADLDGDGDPDGFIGDDDGNVIYFQNTGTSGPAFAGSSANPFGLTDVEYYASPAFADLDADGDLDAFVGNYAGNTLYFQNTGSSSSPAFAVSSSNPFGLAGVGDRANPTFADLDDDGDLDAFVGDYFGDIFYFQNTGSSSSPAFAASSANPFGLAGIGQYANPAFADLDGDGDLDGFIGNQYGSIVYFHDAGGTSPATSTPTNTPTPTPTNTPTPTPTNTPTPTPTNTPTSTPTDTPTSTPTNTPTPTPTDTPTPTPTNTPTPTPTSTPNSPPEYLLYLPLVCRSAGGNRVGGYTDSVSIAGRGIMSASSRLRAAVSRSVPVR